MNKMRVMNNELHVILGAGQIGPMIAERLAEKGIRVRLVKRSPGPNVVTANLTDPESAARAMNGASVVYHTANPRYHRWPQELMPLIRGIVRGAEKAGAKLVALDNLYSYEVPADGVLKPTTKVAPRSKKGALRAQAAEEMLAAKIPVAIARASDFFGPRVTNSLFGERLWNKLLADSRIEVMGDIDQLHTYSYGPDVADGLVTLGLAESDAFGRVWHLPALPAESTRTWIERFAKMVGRTPKTMRLTPFMARLAGLFIPEAKELPEMMYQWEGPYILDDSDFRARFDAHPTPLAIAARDTVEWWTSPQRLAA
jgi:nucleoside-diphosphate-sugar epimerase